MSLDICYRKGLHSSIFVSHLTGKSQRRYWEDEEHTCAVMKKDEHGTLWIRTGDEVIMDEEGYLRSRFLLTRIIKKIFESLKIVTLKLLAESR